MDAGVKLALQRTKWQLKVWAAERSISTEGTKIELAKKIAEYDAKKSERDWKIISGGT